MSAQSALRDREPAGFELIETLRWEPENGFIRIERHLARMAGSADELGFSHDPERIAAVLAEAVRSATTPQRVRLVLSRDCEASTTIQPYEPLPASRVWNLALAKTRLDSTNSLLRHKTTRRDAYVQARAEYLAGEADEVLLSNERGEICEGTITNLFADFGDGILATPSLHCGLLPGILRGELLDRGAAREMVFNLDLLRSAKTIFVGNSLRGLIRARLV